MRVLIKVFCFGWLFFLSAAVFSLEEEDAPEFLEFATNLYGDRNRGKDLEIIHYSSKTVDGPFECINTQTGLNTDKEKRASCDFWWENYSSYDNETPNNPDDDKHYTHTGADFQVGPNSNNVDVYSFGFGRLCHHRDSENNNTLAYVSIEYLLDSGDPVIANYLHFKPRSIAAPISSEIANTTSNKDCNKDHFSYITKRQAIAKEGGSGPAPVHLHLEFSNVPKPAYVETENICTSTTCKLKEEDELKLKRDGLHFYYDKKDINRVWYNPDKILGHKKALIPVINGGISSNLDALFGYEDQEISGSLFTNRETAKQTNFFNILWRQYNGGRDVDEYYRNWSGKESTNNLLPVSPSYVIPSGKNVISGSKKLPRGEYVFTAALEVNERIKYSYPVRYSVLSESELIIDNDQEYLGEDDRFDYLKNSLESSSKIPGYYLTSDLFPPTEDVSVRWKPKLRGHFKIFMHTPKKFSIVKDIWVCPSGLKSCEKYKITKGNSSFSNHRWASIVNNEDVSHVFEFSPDGFVILRSDKINYVSVDAIKFSYSITDVLRIRRLLKIPTKSVKKILRHYMEQSKVPTINTDDDLVVYRERTVAGKEYETYSLDSSKTIYINPETHSISFNLDKCKNIQGSWGKDSEQSLINSGVAECEEE